MSLQVHAITEVDHPALPGTPEVRVGVPGDLSSSAGELFGRRRSRHGRWRRRVLMMLAGLVAAAIVLHQPLLTSVGRLFVLEAGWETADCVLVLGGDRRLDTAAELYHRGAVSRIWLVELEPGYLVREGIVKPSHVVAGEHLRAAGVAPEAVVVLEGRSRGEGDTVRAVQEKLRASPELRVLVLCDRFRCRNIRWAFDSILAEADWSQVALRGLPDAEFDETNWWRCRRGCKAVLMATTDLLHLALMGVTLEESPDFDPDSYERRLRRETAGLACHDG